MSPEEQVAVSQRSWQLRWGENILLILHPVVSWCTFSSSWQLHVSHSMFSRDCILEALSVPKQIAGTDGSPTMFEAAPKNCDAVWHQLISRQSFSTFVSYHLLHVALHAQIPNKHPVTLINLESSVCPVFMVCKSFGFLQNLTHPCECHSSCQQLLPNGCCKDHMIPWNDHVKTKNLCSIQRIKNNHNYHNV